MKHIALILSIILVPMFLLMVSALDGFFFRVLWERFLVSIGGSLEISIFAATGGALFANLIIIGIVYLLSKRDDSIHKEDKEIGSMRFLGIILLPLVVLFVFWIAHLFMK